MAGERRSSHTPTIQRARIQTSGWCVARLCPILRGNDSEMRAMIGASKESLLPAFEEWYPKLVEG